MPHLTWNQSTKQELQIQDSETPQKRCQALLGQLLDIKPASREHLLAFRMDTIAVLGGAVKAFGSLQLGAFTESKKKCDAL